MIRFAHMAGASALVLLAACGGPSSADLEKYSEACVDFYKERRGRAVDEVEMRKHWMKDKKVVISLKVQEGRYAKSYTEELCIVDPEAGTVALPSVFERARWSE